MKLATEEKSIFKIFKQPDGCPQSAHPAFKPSLFARNHFFFI